MNLPFTKPLARHFKNAALLLILCATAACQPEAAHETAQDSVSAEETETAASATVSEARPAPEFFFIPQEMMKKRVWICEGTGSDVFHVQHDCPVLIQCKGKGTFRNLVLPRAIEEFGRYNCQECSKDLDSIFDEDAVRQLGR